MNDIGKTIIMVTLDLQMASYCSRFKIHIENKNQACYSTNTQINSMHLQRIYI